MALPNGTDLGRRLLAGGFARVLVVGRRFSRYPAYVATEDAAKAAGAGMWTACAPAPALADLAVTNTDAPDPVAVGANLTYTVTVTNNGPSSVPAVRTLNTLSDAVPVVLVPAIVSVPATCVSPAIPPLSFLCATTSALPPGASFNVTAVVRPLAAGTLTSTASIVTLANPAVPDPNPANNTAIATTVVTPGAPPPPNCHASYPTVCIPPPPPDLDCGQITFRNFQVIYTVPNPDPHNFDNDRDGIGCET